MYPAFIITQQLIMSLFQIQLTPSQFKKLDLKLPTGYKLIPIQKLKAIKNPTLKKHRIINRPAMIIEENEGQTVADRLKNRRSKSAATAQENEKIKAKQAQINTANDKIFVKKYAERLYQSDFNLKIPIAFQSEEIFHEKEPLNPHKVLQLIKKHKNYDAVAESLSEVSLQQIERKCDSQEYCLDQLYWNLADLFAKIYEHQSRSSLIYIKGSLLQRYAYNLIMSQPHKRSTELEDQRKLKNCAKQEKMQNINEKKNNTKKSKPKNSKNQKAQKKIKLPNLSNKRILGRTIKKLAPSSLQDIIAIVFENENENEDSQEQYVLDLETLPSKKLKQVRRYVETCLCQQKTTIQSIESIQNVNQSQQSSFVIENDFD